jgi:hypothetical protein
MAPPQNLQSMGHPELYKKLYVFNRLSKLRDIRGGPSAARLAAFPGKNCRDRKEGRGCCFLRPCHLVRERIYSGWMQL